MTKETEKPGSMPEYFLTKRADNTYCVMASGMPLCRFMSKADCVNVAKRYNIKLSDWIWSAAELKYIIDK